MANKPKRMDQIRKIIEHYQVSKSIKRTSKLSHTARNTVRQYIRRCKSTGKDFDQLLKMSDEELSVIVYAEHSREQNTRAEHFTSRVENWLSELSIRGVTRHLLWKEYKAEHPEGYSYSQFCDRLSREIASRNLTMAMNHKPGQRVMVDFAGGKHPWTDPVSGKEKMAEVLVCVMPYSHYTYAIALPSQKTPDFITGLNSMFRFLGGVPQVLLSDNLKSYVTRADRYEPKFNELCEQLSFHYGIDLDATRVAKPKDKGSVENMVSTTYQRLYAPLRKEVFHSIEQINRAFALQLNIHNTTPYQKRPGSRQQVFNTDEKPLLATLPTQEFEIKKHTRAKVQQNYHILLGQDNKYYSVHYAHYGKRVDVFYTHSTVEIYDRGKRIALHKRLEPDSTDRYSTHESHMPEHHKAWKKAQVEQPADLLALAKQTGVNTYWAIQYILRTKIHPEQALKTCRGVLRLSTLYSPERLEAACGRCKSTGQVNYRMLKNILKNNLDSTGNNSQQVETKIPDHQNLRGAKTYQ